MSAGMFWSRGKMIFGASVIVTAGWIHCAAQVVSSDSQNERNGSSLNGRVITSGGPAQRDTRIELRSQMGQTVCSAYTDSSGWFHCGDVAPGMYQLIVSAEKNEQTIDVPVSNFNADVTIRIGDREAGQSQGNLASVSELMVPPKARKAFQKASERFERADLAGARSFIDQALLVWPRFAAALTLRGVLKTHSNPKEDALSDFNAALEADRSYGLAYVALAANRTAAGEFDESTKSSRSWAAVYQGNVAITL